MMMAAQREGETKAESGSWPEQSHTGAAHSVLEINADTA